MGIKGLLHGLELAAQGNMSSKLLEQLASKQIPIPSMIMDRAKQLDRHYVPTRYPNIWVEGNSI